MHTADGKMPGILTGNMVITNIAIQILVSPAYKMATKQIIVSRMLTTDACKIEILQVAIFQKVL